MIEQTSAQRAAQVAANIGMQANNLAKMHAAFKANGAPAQGNAPAFTAADYATATGTAQMAILDAMAAANPQT